MPVALKPWKVFQERWTLQVSKPQTVSVHTEASECSGWMRTVSNSRAHYLPGHEVQCVDEGTGTSPRKVSVQVVLVKK